MEGTSTTQDCSALMLRPAPMRLEPFTPSREQDWLPYRDIIIDLFDNKNLTLPEVKRYMKDIYNLDASLDGYKHRLHRTWKPFRNTRKYNEEEAMRAMAVIMNHQAKSGRESHFKFRGKNKSPAQVLKYWRRKKMSIEEAANTTSTIPYPAGLELCSSSDVASSPSTPQIYMQHEHILWEIRRHTETPRSQYNFEQLNMLLLRLEIENLARVYLSRERVQSIISRQLTLRSTLLVLWQCIALAESESQRQNIHEYLCQVLVQNPTLGSANLRNMLLTLLGSSITTLKPAIDSVMRIYIDTVKEESKLLSSEFLWLVINDFWVSQTVVEELEHQQHHKPSILAGFHLMRACMFTHKYVQAFSHGLQVLTVYSELDSNHVDIDLVLYLLARSALHHSGFWGNVQVKAIAAVTMSTGRRYWPSPLWSTVEECCSRPMRFLQTVRADTCTFEEREQICICNLIVSAWDSVRTRFLYGPGASSNGEGLTLPESIQVLIRPVEEQLQPGRSSEESTIEQLQRIIQDLASKCLTARLERASHQLTTALAATSLQSRDTSNQHDRLLRLAEFSSSFEERWHLLRNPCDGALSEKDSFAGENGLWIDYAKFRSNNADLPWTCNQSSSNEADWSVCIYRKDHSALSRVFKNHGVAG